MNKNKEIQEEDPFDRTLFLEWFIGDDDDIS
jgi:hypothetical protein